MIRLTATENLNNMKNIQMCEKKAHTIGEKPS